ncbi:MAG TPA: TetR family transcriptional regulator [Streptosporangiaceae bacterium]|nr:TetR family transcriptional regulator [Streptosporangiaceae bacterium]
MAWDTEGTRRRLQEAATIEFAERGPDGTTMARIAERAGINKERLYKYFGDKQALFETVLSGELEKLAAAVQPLAGGFEDIGEFAGRTFDYHAAHPELVRLLLWEGLAGDPVADQARRTAHYQDKARAYAAAQRAGTLDDDLDPDHLVFLIIALAAWWLAVPQLAFMLTGSDGSDADEHARRRACVVRAAERLARPR